MDVGARLRDIFLLEDDATKIAAVIDSGLEIYNFNETTNTYDYAQSFAISPRAIMQDSLKRVWISDDTGFRHMISPSSPSRTDVQFELLTYEYQGSDINTHFMLNAYDIDNARIGANVRVTLDGDMYFPDNSQTKVVTTSDTGDTQVDVVIKGPSFTRVLTSIEV